MTLNAEVLHSLTMGTPAEAWHVSKRLGMAP